MGHFHLLIDMTTKTTTTKVKTTKPTKATLKKLTAIKRTAGKKARSASAKKNALLVTKKIWAYIKKYKLNDGRTIKPDSTLKAIFPVASIDMLKMAGYVSKHLS